MLSTPKVSILVNCYNGEKYLRDALDSIYAQSYENWEIIFWNNASTDSSKHIALSYKEKLKYFESKINEKLYTARNHALTHCSGEYIAFLDVDDLWYPDKLLKQVQLLNDPKVALVYSNAHILRPDGTKKHTFDYLKPYSGYCTSQLLKQYFLILPCVLIRKELLIQNNLKFNNEVDISGDAELFLKLSIFGKFSYVDDTLAVWRMHDTNMSLVKREQGLIELRSLYGRLLKDPAFNKFSGDISLAYRKTYFSEAKNYIMEGRLSEGRKLLIKNKVFDYKSLFLILLSYFPILNIFIQRRLLR